MSKPFYRKYLYVTVVKYGKISLSSYADQLWNIYVKLVNGII